MVEWMVWSSGLERWEPIVPSPGEVATFVYQHSKTINGQHVAVCVDIIGRYVGGFHPVHDEE